MTTAKLLPGPIVTPSILYPYITLTDFSYLSTWWALCSSMLHLLKADVRCRLRSDVAICSIVQCVEELVLNSLDASATCVAVRVHLSSGQVQVVDNGCGIDRQQMGIVAER